MKSCNRKILELFYNAKHAGRVMKPDAIGRVGEDNDGLVIELTWRVTDGIITEAKFRAFGNPNAIAITSLMTDNIIGKPIEEAILINEDIIAENLDELRPEYIEAYDMVHMAMAEAYNNYLKRQNRKDSVNKTEYAEEYQAEFEQNEFGYETEIEIENQIETERRGRGRPRKERTPEELQALELASNEKRGRGRPRKERTPEELQALELTSTEKRGRGRPRKERTPEELLAIELASTEKRGRGRPRKERIEGEELIITEKRGRGRPRKPVDENAMVEDGEKRGRGRPRKERTPEELQALELALSEKRGRGRPRKIVDESQIVEAGEKRGRGRPRKEVKIELPKSDLDEVINDEEVDQLINGNINKTYETNNFVNNLISNKLIDEDDDMFDADYDLFKSNIRNIFSGKEVDSSNHYGEVKSSVAHDKVEPEIEIKEEILEQKTNLDTTSAVEGEQVSEEKRGRGRPRKIVAEVEVEESEKRGRGRPRKIQIEEIEEVKSTEQPRQRVDIVNSLTRSLSTNGGVPIYNNTQDIVFASKNVTTTNININVTKTTTTTDENQSVSDDYSKNINISSVKENSIVSLPASEIEQDEEIEIEPVELDKNKEVYVNDVEDDVEDKYVDDLDDDMEEEIDTSNIKDEAPKGGIEDLLKALLDD